MKILSTNVYVGPNVYAHFPVIRHVLDLEALEEAIQAGADVVLLDNMSPHRLKEAVRLSNGRVPLEASGGINLKNIEQIAKTGVDIISVGALTHSAKAVDISLEMIPL